VIFQEVVHSVENWEDDVPYLPQAGNSVVVLPNNSIAVQAQAAASFELAEFVSW